MKTIQVQNKKNIEISTLKIVKMEFRVNLKVKKLILGFVEVQSRKVSDINNWCQMLVKE